MVNVGLQVIFLLFDWMIVRSTQEPVRWCLLHHWILSKEDWTSTGDAIAILWIRACLDSDSQWTANRSLWPNIKGWRRFQGFKAYSSPKRQWNEIPRIVTRSVNVMSRDESRHRADFSYTVSQCFVVNFIACIMYLTSSPRSAVL